MRDNGAPSIPSLAKEGGYQALCFAEYEDRHKNNGRTGDVGDDSAQEGLAPRRLVVSKAIYYLFELHRVDTEINRGLSSLQN